MSDEIRTILASLAYAMEEGEVDAGGAASALRWLVKHCGAEFGEVDE